MTTSARQRQAAASVKSRPPRIADRLPAEGENGVFTESWFPLCKSSEIAPGEMRGFDFLDGRVVVMRDRQGEVHVLSAYCPHVGADLSVGKIVGDQIQCAFHEWRFNTDGSVAATAIGDPAPKACLFKYPSADKYGVIWAFNGETPWWDIPDFERPSDALAIRVEYDVPIYPVDPWVICANTPDWQHIKIVHKIAFDHKQYRDCLVWNNYSMQGQLDGYYTDNKGGAIETKAGIFGTSIFMMQGNIGGRWVGILTPFGIPKPGWTQTYFILATEKGDGSEEDRQIIEKVLAGLYHLAKVQVGEDKPILRTIKYAPGYLTASDAMLAKYLKLVREFPRSHAGGEYIR